MATVLYKSCWMDEHIPPQGWTTPPGTTAREAANLTFAEFNSSGPGARASRPFPAQVFTPQQAQSWTVASVLKGWDPLTPSQQPYCLDVPPFCGGGSRLPAKLGLKTDDRGSPWVPPYRGRR